MSTGRRHGEITVKSAAQMLAKAGHGDVASLKGGVQSWIDAGYPVVESADPQARPLLPRP